MIKSIKKVGLINYGVGNLLSVKNAILELGHEPIITNDVNKQYKKINK